MSDFDNKQDENSSPNTLHIVLYAILLFPIFYVLLVLHPLIGILMLIGWLFGLGKRFSTKYSRKKEVESLKKSLPDMNIFHIIMFIIIAFPFLWFSGIKILSVLGLY